MTAEDRGGKQDSNERIETNPEKYERMKQKLANQFKRGEERVKKKKGENPLKTALETIKLHSDRNPDKKHVDPKIIKDEVSPDIKKLRADLEREISHVAHEVLHLENPEKKSPGLEGRVKEGPVEPQKPLDNPPAEEKSSSSTR